MKRLKKALIKNLTVWSIWVAGGASCAGLELFFEEEEGRASFFQPSDRIADQARILKRDRDRRLASWDRQNTFTSSDEYQDFFYQAMASGEVALGMSTTQVRSVWGSPREIQVAGEPEQRNEKWIYISTLFTGTPEFSRDKKIVYFEKGFVVGWEKE